MLDIDGRTILPCVYQWVYYEDVYKRQDCRNNSRLFAEISANIFSANGIKVYLFEDMRPTPDRCV